MARLLRTADYDKYIKEDKLAQVLESDYTLLLDVEQAAQAEMRGYLVQRYQTNRIFTDTSAFDITAVYSGKSLVIWTETAFNAATIYTTGQRVSQSGIIYSSIAGSAAHAFTANEWTAIGVNEAFYYVSLPHPEYDNEAEYEAGDQVWYDDIVYTCLSTVTGILPTNESYWTEGAEYTLTAVTPGDDTKWTQGDNRNQLIVMRLIDITLFHLHSRINPRNIPDLRKERYDGNSPAQVGGAIGWLKQIVNGDFNVDLPQILPVTGLSIRYGNADGSDTFSSNTY